MIGNMGYEIIFFNEKKFVNTLNVQANSIQFKTSPKMLCGYIKCLAPMKFFMKVLREDRD